MDDKRAVGERTYGETATVYDLVQSAMGKDYVAECDQIREIVAQRVLGARSLLDVACGTGGHLRHLQHHFSVTGVDLDDDMVAQARIHVTTGPILKGDMRDLQLRERFDVVTCLFASIAYCVDTGELDSAVSSLARHLTPGGVLIVDGFVRRDAWIEGGTRTMATAATDEVKVARMVRSTRDGDTALLEMHYLVADKDGIEHRVTHHALRLFSRADFQAAFRANGLSFETLRVPVSSRDRYVGVAPTT